MSIEVVQFVEMVREAGSREDGGSKMDQSKPPEGTQSTQPNRCIQLYEIRSYHCGVCGGEREHTIEKQGMDEVWRCCSCGIGKVFRIWMG